MKKGSAVIVTVSLICLAMFLTACGGATNAKGPVYLKTKQVYYDISSGEVQSQLNWEYDDRGNKVRRVITTVSNGAEVNAEDVFTDFDQDGYPAKSSTSNGSQTKETTYEYTKENGRVVKVVESSGSEKTYAYHDDGKLKSNENKSANGSTSLYEYDEDGYLIKNESSQSGGSTQSSTLMWTKGDDGTPTQATFNMVKSGESQLPVSYTIQCDNNGNIARVYTALGKLYEQIEYTRIDNPSVAAWVEGNAISL